MMRLVGSLSPYYQPRIYVVAETDKMSAEKIISFEKNKTEKDSSEVCWTTCNFATFSQIACHLLLTGPHKEPSSRKGDLLFATYYSCYAAYCYKTF